MTIKELIKMLQDFERIYGSDAFVFMWGDDIINAYAEILTQEENNKIRSYNRINFNCSNITSNIMEYFRKSKRQFDIDHPYKYCSALIYDIRNGKENLFHSYNDDVKNHIIKIVSQNYVKLNECVKKYYNYITPTSVNMHIRTVSAELESYHHHNEEVESISSDLHLDNSTALANSDPNIIHSVLNPEDELIKQIYYCMYYKNNELNI